MSELTAQTLPTRETATLPVWPSTALFVVSGVAGLLTVFGWASDPRRFVFSYLTAFAFVATLAFGTLAWLMIQHLTGATWSVSLRRPLENLSFPLLAVALLFIPVALNVGHLYVWADPSRIAADPALARKTVWLNPTFFTARSVAYLVIWTLLAAWLRYASVRLDQTSDLAWLKRMRGTSTWGLIVLGLTTSLAAFDWLMSLDPHWSSTIYAVYVWAGALVGSLAALILLLTALKAAGVLERLVTIEQMHDLGKLLFGFVIFWAYIAFSQYFLIWYANFPEETGWYILRREGTWNTLSWLLVFGHFVVPFVLLLPRAMKRDPFWLPFLAAWVLAFHYVDLYWLVMPGSGTGVATPTWRDALVPLAMTSLFAALVLLACRARPLVPVGDPRLAGSTAYRNP